MGLVSAATSTSPGISLLLDDRYRVEEPIARGGMATVYRGHDQRLDRVVALKIMHPHLATDENFRRRFGREARAAARLAHRNVVGVFDQGEDEDRIYLAMELVEGVTLRSRIADQGRLTVGDALDVTAQTLQALVAAHAAGIVHRDIKPENILIGREGTVKVADFGLARAIGTSNSSASATLLGTVAYISPEVVTRGQMDERSDLYSLGVVLFEMLTGVQPFTGDQPVHIAFQHVHEDIPAPSGRVEGVPTELDSLITWASSRTVEHRPSSAAELLRSVQDLRRTLPAGVLATRPRSLENGPDTSTGEVRLATARLDEALASLRTGPRPFAAEAPDVDVPGTDTAADAGPRASAAVGPEPLPDDGADTGRTALPPGEDGDGATTGTGDAGDDVPSDGHGEGADEPPRTVVMRAPRARRGRHLPLAARRRSRPAAMLAIGSLVAALGTGAWSGVDWYANTGPGADRTIPVLVGTQLTDAEQALDSADLTIRTVERYDDTVPAGHVITASPSSGGVVKKGTAVELVVSRGEQVFEVPDLTGLGVDEARDAVEAQNLVLVEDDPEYSETVPKGQVISQSQEADSLPEGGEVHVVVSQGRVPIAVSDQTGRGADAARSALEGAGFTVTTSSAHSSSVPKGSVVSQSPASGTLHRGDTVNLVISQGPEMVTVPDVFKKSEADARSTLEAAGLKVSVEHPKGDPAFGLVYQQSATAGDQVAKGSTVTISVF